VEGLVRVASISRGWLVESLVSGGYSRWVRSSAALVPLLLVGRATPPTARADGAFPDELQVFLPASPPNRILLTTNFGLLRSDDDGQSFSYLCEPTVGTGNNISLY